MEFICIESRRKDKRGSLVASIWNNPSRYLITLICRCCRRMIQVRWVQILLEWGGERYGISSDSRLDRVARAARGPIRVVYA
jgi:hypothetical protein